MSGIEGGKTIYYAYDVRRDGKVVSGTVGPRGGRMSPEAANECADLRTGDDNDAVRESFIAAVREVNGRVRALIKVTGRGYTRHLDPLLDQMFGAKNWESVDSFGMAA